MESNKTYNSKAYENLKSLEATYCQLCDITNSKQFDCEIYDYLPHEIDIDKFTSIYLKRIHAQIDIIKRGKKIMYIL